MKKKAFTFLEITLVMAVVAIIAASAIPFMLKTFTGYNEIANQADIVNKLQEISSVITRRIISDKKEQPATLNLDYINGIINDMSLGSESGNYKMHNNIIIKKLVKDDIENRSNDKFKKIDKIPHNCLRITLTATREKEQHKLRFIVYPVFN